MGGTGIFRDILRQAHRWFFCEYCRACHHGYYLFIIVPAIFKTHAKKNIDYLAKSYVEYMNLKNLKFILFKLRFFSIPIVFN